MRAPIPLALLLAVACSGVDANPPPGPDAGPSVTVDASTRDAGFECRDDAPATLDFGVVPGGAEVMLEIAACSATLDDPDGAFAIVHDAGRLLVRFSPRHVGAHAATLITAEGTTALTAEGALPRLAIAPTDFGDVRVGCPISRAPVLENLESHPITLTHIRASGDAFSTSSDPITVAANGRREIYVGFAPATATDHEGGLVAVLEDFTPNTIELERLSGRGFEVPYVVDRWQRPPVPSIDFVFVIHRSADGLSETAVRQNVHALFDFIRAQGLDARVTFLVGDPARGPLDRAFIDPDDPDAYDAMNRALDEALVPRDDARLFEALEAHVADPNAWRSEASLSAIFVSDRDDASASTVDQFFDRLHVLGAGRFSSVSAVAGDAPGGCSGRGGVALPAPRLVEVATRSGGVSQSACTADWSRALETPYYWPFFLSFGFTVAFPLSTEPIVDTITVTIDDTLLPPVGPAGTVNWAYDPQGRRVRPTPFSTPEPSARVRIAYAPACGAE